MREGNCDSLGDECSGWWGIKGQLLKQTSEEEPEGQGDEGVVDVGDKGRN